MAILKNSTVITGPDKKYVQAVVLEGSDPRVLTPVAYRIPGLEPSHHRQLQIGTYQLIKRNDFVLQQTTTMGGSCTELLVNVGATVIQLERYVKREPLIPSLEQLQDWHPWLPQFLTVDFEHDRYIRSLPDIVAPIWSDVDFTKKKRYLENIITKYGLPFKSKTFMGATAENISEHKVPITELPEYCDTVLLFNNTVVNHEYYLSDGNNKKAKPLICQPRIINPAGRITMEGKKLNCSEVKSRYIVGATTMTVNQEIAGMGITVFDCTSQNS